MQDQKEKKSPSSDAGSGGDRRKNFQKNPRRPSRRPARVKPEFDQKIVSIRRVTRVVTGGRRFSFSVSIVAGDRKGRVGVGIGKAGDTALAIEKAFRDAKKNMIKVKLNEEMKPAFEVRAKYCGSEILMIPTRDTKIVAGSSVRTVIDLAGIKGVSAKVVSRSKNQLNNAKAAIKALRQLEGATKK